MPKATNIELVHATPEDAPALYAMQKAAFAPLLERYRDYDTSPAAEPLSRTEYRLAQPETYYYFILADGERVGAVRVCDWKDSRPKRISPIFILPEHQSKGVGMRAMRLIEALHGETNWSLGTIKQEERDCHFYKKLGYRLSGEETVVNERMTIVGYIK